MRWILLALLGVAACAPCPGQRYVAKGAVDAATLEPELASCAGQRTCNAPCVALFHLDGQDTIETCQVTVDAQGNGAVVARYIDRSVCGNTDVVDPASGDVVVDTGDWGDWTDDGGSTDDGSTDTGSDDGSCNDGSCDGGSDDGSTDSGSDDGSTDDGSTDDGGERTAPTPRPVRAHAAATQSRSSGT